MADTGAKVGTKAGKVNVPDDVPEATNETLAVPEPAVDPEALDGARSAAVPGAEEFNGEGAFPWIEELAETLCLNIQLSDKKTTLLSTRL